MHDFPKYQSSAVSLEYVNQDAPKGGELVRSSIGSFDSLNPFAVKGTAANGLSLVYDRLMARVWDEPFTMYPLIARDIVVPDDRSEMTIKINPKARFNDGSQITADDVIFSLNVLKEGGRPNMRRIYSLAETVEKRGDLEVYIKFGEGYDRETVMIFAMMPVLCKKWWEGRKFDGAVLDVPVTNGPYRITEFEPGRRIVYERVKDYWAKDLLVNVGQNNFDRIVYEYFRDDAVALEAFKAGEVNFRSETDINKWKNNYDFPAVDKGDVVLEEIKHGRPERVRSLIFNTRREPFNDIRVRKALELIFDFDWVNKNIYYDSFKRINSYFPNSYLAATGKPSDDEIALLEPFRDSLSDEVFSEVYTPPVSSTPAQKRANLRKADELLKDAGWGIENGVRIKNGNKFSFEIIISSYEEEKMLLPFIRDLERMGIHARLRNLESSSFTKRMMDYDFDMSSYNWLSTLSPGTEQYLYWSCESANTKSRWNYMGVCNPALDYLSRKISSARTKKELVSMAHAIDRVLLAGHYIIPLGYTGKDYIAHRDSIKRPQITPIYGVVAETFWQEN